MALLRKRDTLGTTLADALAEAGFFSDERKRREARRKAHLEYITGRLNQLRSRALHGTDAEGRKLTRAERFEAKKEYDALCVELQEKFDL